MGGELDIESEEGKGSTFFFTLTLEKAKEAEPRKIINMLGFNVGLLVEEGRVHDSVKRNLERYVTYAGAKFDVYDVADIMDSDDNALPDIIFIDHAFHQRKGELDKFVDLESKIVLMTTADKKKAIENIIDRIDRILYKPLNLTKTLKTLEIAYDETVKRSVKPQTQTKNIVFENLHVLVAEDNNINQKLIKNVLNGFGIDVTLASNGEEAVNLRMQNDYDMIFMDIQMPVLGGVEATHKILEYEEKSRKHHIPIVALTANALSGDKEKYLEEGMDNYLSKPINLERLNILLQEYFPYKAVIKTEEEEEKDNTQEISENEKPVSKETLETAETVSSHIRDESVAYPREESVFEEQILTEEDTISGEPEIEDENEEITVLEDTYEELPAPKSEEKVLYDVLLYHPLTLIADLYERILTNLGYSVDTVKDEMTFMDRIEANQYRFIIFDGESFMKMKCMVSDMIKGLNAIPFVILSKSQMDEDFCCDTLEEGAHVEMIKQKLEAAEGN